MKGIYEPLTNLQILILTKQNNKTHLVMIFCFNMYRLTRAESNYNEIRRKFYPENSFHHYYDAINRVLYLYYPVIKQVVVVNHT